MATTFTVDTSPFLAQNYVQINWTNAGQGPNHYSYRVYRRTGTTGTWAMIYETVSTSSPYVYKDYSIPAQTSVQYAVVDVNQSQVEETKNPSALTGALMLEKYWFNHPTDATLSFSIGATSDSFGDEYDEKVFNLIGRGRKIDVGTNWGVTGTIEGKLIDKESATARVQRLQIELLRSTQTYFWLKNPFGDYQKIALGKISFERQAGTGTSEVLRVTIPYYEVA